MYTVTVMTTFSQVVETITAASRKAAIVLARDKFDARAHHCIRVSVEDSNRKVIFGKREAMGGIVHEVFWNSDGTVYREQLWDANGTNLHDSWNAAQAA